MSEQAPIESPAKTKRRGRRPDVVFQDQGRKLAYLVDVWGDQRPRNRRNPRLAVEDDTTWLGRSDRLDIVETQEGLALLLGVDPARVTGWRNGKKRIGSTALAIICELYGVDEASFRADPYEVFVLKCTGRWDALAGMSGLSLAWRRHIDRADDCQITLVTDDPFRPPQRPRSRLRHPVLSPRGSGPRHLEVARKAPFWIGLASPDDEEANPVWRGWHILLFSHDCSSDSFRCLLSGRQDEDVAIRTYPDDGVAFLPSRPLLRHEAPDLGIFEIIAILTRIPVPAELLERLSEEEAHGMRAEPCLDVLAHWLTLVEDERGVAIRRIRYQVVAPAAGELSLAD